jgi:hypothetical protein
MNFLLEVLYDENFNFGLKRRILEKIAVIKSIQKLNRMCTIRNYFSHCNQEVYEFDGNKDVNLNEVKGIVIDPLKIDTAVDFTELYNEYKSSDGEVATELYNIFVNKGGKTIAP